MLGIGSAAPPLAVRKLLTSTDAVNFSGVSYLWDDTETWADAFVWKD